jgi:nucleoside-diphosphate-sugar epimerase
MCGCRRCAPGRAPDKLTCMATETRASTFVTGAGGFIGSELVKALVERRHQVFALTDSIEAAERVRRAGALPVIGDLFEPGPWQDQAAADWVFHVPPSVLPGTRVTRRRTSLIARARVRSDAHLLDAVATGATRRIVYVADASSYGATHGPRAITEDAPPQPSAWGACLTPALDRLDGYIVAGLPIVTALPGWVYGNGGWFRERVIRPILDGRRVLMFGSSGPWVSPVHVEDCARALIHLAERGEPGGRYFVVNRDPVHLHDFAERFAQIAKRPLRLVRLPAVAARFVVGPVVAEHLRTDAVYSNLRLRAIGFRFLYPTLDQGLRRVLRELRE